MKKNLLLVTALLLMTNKMFSQVGINTQNPQGIFNIDGAKDNPVSGTGHSASQQLNDFTVLSNGNVGIGTIAPTQKLEIQTGGTSTNPITGFKLVDGNQGQGKILMSDADGIGTWKSLLVGAPVNGVFSWAANTAIGNNNWNSIASLVIPPGAHNIFTKIHLIVGTSVASNSYVRLYVGTKNLNTNNSNASDTPLLGSNNFSIIRPGEHFELSQQFIYNNTTNANITLYFNLQSDYTDLTRSIYTYNTLSNFKGVSLIENFYFGVPILN